MAVFLYSAELVLSYVHAIQKRETVAVNRNISSHGCFGWVTLLSDYNALEIRIDSNKLHPHFIERKNKIKKIRRKGMRFAKVNGNCCWEVRERFHGGETKELWRSHTYYLPWSIRAIKLIRC